MWNEDGDEVVEGEREAGDLGRIREERKALRDKLAIELLVRPAMASEISASCFKPEKS